MIHFNRHILDNGLTMLHHEDPGTPFVVLNLLYKVGARNEDPDHTGFAHLFEHLMFEGTKQVPSFDQPLQEAGGINNAFTNNDYTNYYIKLPKENIGLALYLEADRMQNLDINQDKLATQKKVVIEEFKENYTNKPYGDVWHLLRSMVYEEHPYQWPVIGKDYDHIRKAGLDTVISFFNTYYHPSNAILCLAGNLSFEEAKKLSEQYFKDLPDNSKEKAANFHEPAQSEAKRKTVHRDIPTDAIYMVFKMPGRKDEGYYSADMLSDILAGTRSSRLNEQLVKQQHLFTSIDAYQTGTIDTGMFVIEGRLRDGVTPEDGEKAIWNELEKLGSAGPDKKELEKVKNKLITYLNFSENDLLSRAIGLSYHEMLGDAAGINQDEAQYIAIKANDITGFIEKFLGRHQSSVLYYLKEQS